MKGAREKEKEGEIVKGREKKRKMRRDERKESRERKAKLKGAV